MELNQKIHEWLGHKRTGNHSLSYQRTGVYECVSCGVVCHAPDYTTGPAACLELIEAVRKKGNGHTINLAVSYKGDCDVTIWPGNGNEFDGDADTLPMALARAVEKLIDAETTTEATDARFKSR